MQGCNDEEGCMEEGYILVEGEEDVKALSKHVKDLVAKCGCKGLCNSNQCSCIKREAKRVGCDCEPSRCQNKVISIQVKAAKTEPSNEQDEDMQSSEDVNEVLEGLRTEQGRREGLL